MGVDMNINNAQITGIYYCLNFIMKVEKEGLIVYSFCRRGFKIFTNCPEESE